eukprot:1547299-Rhodomonas_salina.1
MRIGCMQESGLSHAAIACKMAAVPPRICFFRPISSELFSVLQVPVRDLALQTDCQRPHQRISGHGHIKLPIR